MEYARLKQIQIGLKQHFKKSIRRKGAQPKKKIAYYLAIKEKFLDDKKDILMIMPRRKFKDKILSREFFIATEKKLPGAQYSKGRI